MNYKTLLAVWATVCCCCAISAPAAASPGACSRALSVPVAPIGQAVMLKGQEVTGIYPDLLRASLAGKPGCSAAFPVVPRARQEMLYETGQADLLLPARRSPRRDQHGIFVPLIKSRAGLVTLLPRMGLVAPGSSAAPAPGLRSLAELLARKELRVAVVRGYDYGQAYQDALSALTAEGRLQQVVDPLSLARTLDARLADVAILTPTILTGALHEEPRYAAMAARLRFEAVDELTWGESGVYVSTRSRLGAADRQLLVEALEQVARSGAAWKAFQHYHPDEGLADSVQPR